MRPIKFYLDSGGWFMNMQFIALLSFASLTACGGLSVSQSPVLSSSPVVHVPESANKYMHHGDPFFINFETMSAKLDRLGEARLDELVFKMKGASKILLHGNCNKNEIGNPQQASWARAMEVKKYLVKKGIGEKKIFVGANIDEPLHGVRIEIHL
ncbi:OmpA family protein [Formivibrio citricus]|nr:hypothetical protein [Formivibrio citricus]